MFNYNILIGRKLSTPITFNLLDGIMNLLNKLSQSNRLINIGNDLIICLMVSRTEEVPRGMGKKESLMSMNNFL